MEKEVFQKRYLLRQNLCMVLGSIKPMSAFVHELAGNTIEYGKESFKYVQIIQKDLYHKRAIPFMVKGLKDLRKIERVTDEDVRHLLWYVWLAWRNLEECNNLTHAGAVTQETWYDKLCK